MKQETSLLHTTYVQVWIANNYSIIHVRMSENTSKFSASFVPFINILKSIVQSDETSFIKKDSNVSFTS